jgi:GT2 family glycosyltransferase
MDKQITIVIPNYNGQEILQENLPRIIQASKKYNAPIIIVDDKSTDNSLEILKTFPDIQVITKEKNEGFSSTVNLGVKNAKTELVCLLNSDVIPSENFLDPMLAHFNDMLIAAVGMHDLSDDGQSHGRGKFIFNRGFLLHQKLINPMQTEITSGSSGWASCGSGVFSKKIWDELGGLDETLNPFYYEDVDYGYRCWKSGYKIFFEQNAIVQHIHKKGAIKSNYNEDRIKTISYRNQFLFNWKNLTDLDLLLLHKFYLPYNFLIALKNMDWPFFKGFFEALKLVPKMIQKRTITTRNFRLKDWELINKVLTS